MILQLKVSLPIATWFSCFLGIFLTIGLSFSPKIRCLVLLVLPQFFSKKGRAAIVAYTFVLALSGPATNTIKNTEVLSTSLTCGQNQLKSAVKGMVEIIRKPFIAIKNAVRHVIKVTEKILQKVKKVLMKLEELIKKICMFRKLLYTPIKTNFLFIFYFQVKVIKSAFNWLADIVNVCNKKIGTPFERCSRVFEDAVADCKYLILLHDFLCF